MDKNAIKKYAVWARNELIARVSQKAQQYGITAGGYGDKNADSVNGVLLSTTEKKQRQALIAKIDAEGFEQVMEEVAYTWFNRFTALRFMEVNNYLPSHTRVFTNEANEFKPQILADAISLELEGLDMDKVFELKNANKDEELYKYLLIVQCNALSSILPGMFQKIADYTELLLPDHLLRDGSIVEQLIVSINEEDWTEQVEIIGWLYQYYISEKHEEVVNPLYGKGIKKEDIPAATQLFTTDWIVRYMVDNSLGKYWIERHPNCELISKLDYYVPTQKEYEIKESVSPESISFLDSCVGSGHILSYAFDVLLEIYRECGYTDKEAAHSIIENNLYGLDIDDRAYQLASFAVMMKARSIDRRFFAKEHRLKIASLQESNNIPINAMNICDDEHIAEIGKYLITAYKDAKEIGSLLEITSKDYEKLIEYIDILEENSYENLENYSWIVNYGRTLKQLAFQAIIMSQKYTIVCTNPPYMNNLKGELKKYIFKNYKDYSGDIFSAFIVRNLKYSSPNGYSAYMTPNVWMYIKSFEKLRDFVISQKSITSFLLLAKGAFYKEATVDICSFVLCNTRDLEGSFVRLEDYRGDMEQQKAAFLDKERILSDNNIFYRTMEQFNHIPGQPIAFWISDEMLNTFEKPAIESKTTAKAGIVSGNDGVFLRLWYEINFRNITFDATNFNDKTAYRWVPINKGGAFRRYYGNYEYVIDIYDLWNTPSMVNESVRRSEPEYYFKQALTWSYVTTGKSSFRITENKTSATASPNLFFYDERELYYALAFTNCCIAQNYLDLLNPTINLNVTNVSTLPLIDCTHKEDIISLCKENIRLAKSDWDSFETSWDFLRDPLVITTTRLEEACELWIKKCKEAASKLKKNEELINSYFLQAYNLENEISPEVEEKYVTIQVPDQSRVIRNFISYAVGCMFGRYSMKQDGIAFAGGEWEETQYEKVMPDRDNIIPICDDEYFEDDIVSLFVKFVEVTFGEQYLEENLNYIATALGGKDAARQVIRNYFINDFYLDHTKMYQKRPIYWLFDSGKKNGFKCLIYMHRYQPDTIARIRTDYVHEQQSRYRTVLADLEQRISGASTNERVKLSKQINTIQDQAEEIRKYEEKIHHLADQMISIDLDDGVKVNYAKFQDVLAKIK